MPSGADLFELVEGLALACYVAAYAGRRDEQAADLAREAVERFATGPDDALHRRRRADAERLLGEITSGFSAGSVEDPR